MHRSLLGGQALSEMGSTAITPLKHASDTDYTSSFVGFTAVITVISIIAIATRYYARIGVKKFTIGLDVFLLFSE
jgi:hypothetical protein